MVNRVIRTPLMVAVVALWLLAALLGGTAGAAHSGGEGEGAVYSGCRLIGGNIIKVHLATEADRPCKPWQTVITWSAEGPQGIQGIQGIQGVAGTDGVDGLDGADGADGTDGLPGLDGADGADGAPGLDGTDGADGADGANGADGADGATGPPGPGSVGASFLLPSTGSLPGSYLAMPTANGNATFYIFCNYFGSEYGTRWYSFGADVVAGQIKVVEDIHGSIFAFDDLDGPTGFKHTTARALPWSGTFTADDGGELTKWEVVVTDGGGGDCSVVTYISGGGTPVLSNP